MGPPGPEFWDHRFTEDRFAYGEQPNRFLADVLAQLAPGRLLLPAEGEGRNAAHAAGAGWTVRAFDFSAEGKKRALGLAAARGVSFEYEHASWRQAVVEPGWAEVVGLVFAHMPPGERRSFHRAMAAGLAPGGLLALEGFEVGQLGRSSGGPKDEKMLFSPAALADDFSALVVERLEVVEVVLDEGSYHQGPARVVRLLARAPS